MPLLRTLSRFSSGLLLAALLAVCGPSTPAPAGLFSARTPALAEVQCGRPEVPTILEVNGGGVALFDADDDGDLDLLLVSPGPYPAAGVAAGGTNRLYRNDGDWQLVDVTPGSGVDVPGFCNGVAVADVDGDGRRDLYLTRLGPNALLRNVGGMRFELVPDAAGAAGSSWSTSAAFVDMDRDGDQDLYVVNYLQLDPATPPLHGQDGLVCTWKGKPVMCGPQGLAPQADRYYRNDAGRFVEATQSTGFGVDAAYGLGVLEDDFDQDGWPDLYVTNDSMPNRLFMGTGDGKVRETGLLAGAALSDRGREQAGMGLTTGDVEGDGDIDLLVTNFSMEANALYLNLGGGRFRDGANPSGLGGPSRRLLGWGVAFLDVDLDGDEDVVCANGHVYPQADDADTDTAYAQPDTIWLNDGTGRFSPTPWPGETPEVSRALAFGDLDDDGRTDLVVLRRAGVPMLWQGQGAGRSSLQVVVVGGPGNPDGCGSVVFWEDALGTRQRRVRTNGGYQAVNDPRPVFAWRGAGTLRVRFPDGREIERQLTQPGRVRVEMTAP